MIRVAFIGAGNMAQAIRAGMQDNHVEYYFYSPSGTKAKELSSKFEGHWVKELKDFNDKKIDYFILGMKPQNFMDFKDDFISFYKIQDEVFVSIMAGINLSTLQEELKTQNIIRIMPNLPIEVQKGVNLVCSPLNEDNLRVQNFLSLFKGAQNYLMTEKQLEIATVISGCGPAYYFYFLEHLAMEVSKMGIDYSLASKLFDSTFQGASQYLKAKDEIPLNELISRVTSKGGVTIEAIKEFEENKLPFIFSKALNKAYEKNLELSKFFLKD